MEMVRRVTKMGVAACALAALAVGVRAQDAANATAGSGADDMANLASQIDFSTLASNPTQVLALLPQMGFSQQCQQNIMGAGAVCLTDFQSLGSLMSDPDVAAEIQKVTGVDVSSAAAAAEGGNVTSSEVQEAASAMPTLTEAQISQLADALLPKIQKELPTKDASGQGMISAACCTQMTPLVTDNCMCTEKALNMVYAGLKAQGRDITDLNPYAKIISGIMDKLQCTALDDMVIYPSSSCPASRRMGFF